MRSLPVSLQAMLDAGVTTLAHVWRIQRRDGEAFAFTDHDRPLAFDDLMCAPLTGLTAGAMEKSVGLSVDNASIGGVLSGEALAEADLARGLWDCARVDVYRVNWGDPAARLHLFSGRIGEVRRGVRAFEAELRGLQAPLNEPVGRVFSRFCDAALGDVRCGKNIESAAFRGVGLVAEIVDARVFRASGLGGYGAGWFSRGRLLWAGGGESEIVSHQIGGGGYAVLELRDAPAAAVSLGASFTVYAGCDKRAETCRGKFANIAAFRGFPHMPGNDALQAGPDTAALMDGGSRFR